MNNRKNEIMLAVGGIFIGLINGILGAGGGLLAVPLLKKYGLAQNAAHACALAVMLPLSVISAGLYLANGTVKIETALPYLLPGVLGAALGATVLNKISPPLLRKAFAAVIIISGLRMLL